MCLQNFCLFPFTALIGTRSSPNTFGYRVRFQGNPQSPDLDFDRNNLSMCTPAASVREYYQTALPRAPRSRVLAILADRVTVEAVQSLRAGGPHQRRSTARYEPNS